MFAYGSSASRKDDWQCYLWLGHCSTACVFPCHFSFLPNTLWGFRQRGDKARLWARWSTCSPGHRQAQSFVGEEGDCSAPVQMLLEHVVMEPSQKIRPWQLQQNLACQRARMAPEFRRAAICKVAPLAGQVGRWAAVEWGQCCCLAPSLAWGSLWREGTHGPFQPGRAPGSKRPGLCWSLLELCWFVFLVFWVFLNWSNQLSTAYIYLAHASSHPCWAFLSQLLSKLKDSI